ATFLVDCVVAFEDGDLGIGDRHRHDEVERRRLAVEFPAEIAMGLRQIDDAELEGAADLLGGEADAGGGVHGFDHVACEQGEFGVEAGYGSTFLAQHGIVVVNYLQNHGSFIGRNGGFASGRPQPDSPFCMSSSSSSRGLVWPALLLALGGLALAGVAWLLPVNLLALPTTLLREAGEGTPSVTALGEELLAREKIGPAALVLNAARNVEDADA